MKRNRAIITILAIAMALGVPCLNARLVFNHHNVKDGLQDNYVKSMACDKYGRMWLVAGGISTYDGYHIHNLDLPDGFRPQRIIIDGGGNIWTEGSDTVMVLKGNRFVDSKDILANMGIRPRALSVKSEGTELYILTADTLYCHSYNDRHTFRYALRQKYISDISPDPRTRNSAYVLLTDGNVRHINMSVGQMRHVGKDTAGHTRLTTTGDEHLWIFGAPATGMSHIDISTSGKEIMTTGLAPSYLVTDITIAQRGHHYLATNNNGVLIIDSKGNVTDCMQHDSGDPFSLTSNHITALFSDSRSLMVGTGKSGFETAAINAPSIERVSIGIDEDISFFKETPDGGMLVGTDGKGLALYLHPGMSEPVKIFDTTNSELKSNAVIGIADVPGKSGRYLAGTYGGGAYIVEGNGISPCDNLPSKVKYVRHMLVMSDSGVWAGTFDDGLYLSDRFHFTKDNSVLRTNCITGLTATGDTLVIATSTGLYTASGKNPVITDIKGDGKLATLPVTAICRDRRGMFWLGTDNGLIVTDRQFNIIARITEPDGLADNTVRAIVLDQNDNIWTTGNHSLSNVTVNVKNGEYRFEAIPLHDVDGLGDITFNRYAMSCLSDGSILAGGLGKYVRVMQDPVQRTNPKDKVYLSTVSVDGIRIFGGSRTPGGHVIIDKDISSADNITVDHGQDIMIEVSTFDFANTGRVRFEYRLGDNHDWTPLESNRLTLEGLPWGKIHLWLRVKGSDNTTHVVVNVRPPVFLSWPAIVIYILIIAVVSVAATLRLKRRHGDRRKREMVERAFESDENSVSARDDLFLTRIRQIVDSNISDETFGVERLSEAMSMSRSSLYKRLHALTGKTPLEFIRLVKIRKGKTLMDQGVSGVAQVAYRVGLSPKQFSKYFKEEYGVLPSAYRPECNRDRTKV